MMQKLKLAPGINRQLTGSLLEGGWSDGNLVRFKDGVPEPVGGWQRVSPKTYDGVCRGMHGWVQLNGIRDLALGTHRRLHLMQGGSYYDITPAGSTGTLTNPFDTTNGSATVTVHDVSHGMLPGDLVVFENATAVGGITIDGEYEVVTAATDSYTIAHAATASGTVAGGGGSVDFIYLIPVGLVDGRAAGGWGAGGWGEGPWNWPRPASLSLDPRIWTLDNWGEELVGNPIGLGLYRWRPVDGNGTRATAIPNAPTRANSVMVGMPERHLIAFGAETGGIQDPMLIRWSDVEDYTVWTASSLNSAGSFRLVGGTRIVGRAAATREILVWTDAVLWSMRFSGLPYVYTFERRGSGCGLVAPHAVVMLGDTAYWMSYTNFMAYNGSVREIPCDIWDDVFGKLTPQQRYKVVAGANASFNEVWWFYPSEPAKENVAAAILNVATGKWSKGSIKRSAWIDRGAFPNPIGAEIQPDVTAGMLHYHESGVRANDVTLEAYVVSGWIDIADGQEAVFLDRLVPDFKVLNGTVTVTLKARRYPDGPESVSGPFRVGPSVPFISPRLRGRELSIRIESGGGGSFWRMGAPRVRIAPDGRAG